MGTNRNIVLCIVFTIITFGIYGIYWFVKMTDETNAMAGNNQLASGVLAFVLTLVTCGLYSLYWSYKMGEKVDQINDNQGGNSNILYLILSVVGLSIVVYILAQDCINKRVSY